MDAGGGRLRLTSRNDLDMTVYRLEARARLMGALADLALSEWAESAMLWLGWRLLPDRALAEPTW